MASVRNTANFYQVMNPTLALFQFFDIETKIYKLQCKCCRRFVVMYKAGEKDNDLIKEQAQLHMKNFPGCVIPNINEAEYTIEEPL